MSAHEEAVWAKASERIAGMLGLHFPRERWRDLRRALQASAADLGLEDAAACARLLAREAPDPAQLRILASHLTIGETYFFRDPRVFEALRERLLPQLIESRRSGERRLRLWSAACSSGEEAYSLAILVRELLLPDLDRWHVTITATDVNPRSLQRAAAAVYGDWSFRGTGSAFKARNFRVREDGRYEVRPEIRRMVRFAPLNLVQDPFPSLLSDTNAMDVIFCRNVLMYFTPEQMRSVIAKLHQALLPGGLLAVAPSESSHALFGDFRMVPLPGAIFFRKHDRTRPNAAPRSRQVAEPDVAPAPAAAPPPEASWRVAPTPAPPVSPAPSAVPEAPVAAPGPYEARARERANEGALGEALSWCDRWVAAEKMSAPAHYLRAIVLIEQGRIAEADTELMRTLYLDPAHVMAHVSAAQLARSRGREREARRHFSNALREVRRLPADSAVPDSDGLSAARLGETLAALAEAAA